MTAAIIWAIAITALFLVLLFVYSLCCISGDCDDTVDEFLRSMRGRRIEDAEKVWREIGK